jgi:hypothetical protein
VQKACLTRVILDAEFTDLKLRAGVDCSNDSRQKRSRLLVTHTACTGSFNIEGDTTVEVHSTEAMSLRPESVMTLGDQQRQFSTSAQYKWLPDDCGNVKPFDLKHGLETNHK